ncbi:hypothetical protein CRE_01390 [Caenorhabditis remanei]|uniref:Uncharacterized protein n=1 Tax=Caenorhabditis remanei TaxID=31234 RepID=E3NG04_CAERE|nr:hypothetical protein CRE_01390 [Caenorhabditis remanei]
MANQRPNLLPLEHVPPEGYDRPPNIRGPYVQHPPRHPQPREEDVVTRQMSFEQFFDRRTPFTVTDIRLFARLEETWTINLLPNSIFDGESLRLFVWRQERPTPAVHWEQSVIRLPVIQQAPRAQQFFLRYARSVHEPMVNGVSRRCPICGSQILGYPMWDHAATECPFADLRDTTRIEFMSINLVSFCNLCNSRSATHITCTPLLCQLCRRPGHTTATDLCHHRFGHPQNVNELRAFVYNIRRQHNMRMRQMLQSGQHQLLYRSHVDNPYHLLLRRMPANRQQVHRGLHFFEDWNNEFPFPEIRAYIRARENRRADYRSMVPPEFFNQAQAPIPLFDEESIEYLERIGQMVTEARMYPDRVKSMHLPPPPTVNRRPVYPRHHPHQVQRQYSPPVQRPLERPAVQRPIDRNLVETPILRADPPGLRQPPRFVERPQYGTPQLPTYDHSDSQPSTSARPTSAVHQNSTTPSASESTSNQPNLCVRPSESISDWALHMEQKLEMEIRAQSAMQVVETLDNHSQLSSEANTREETPEPQPSQQASQSQSPQQNGKTSDTTAERPTSAASTHTSSPSQGSQASNGSEQRDIREANLDREMSSKVLLWCHEPLKILDQPARHAFQHRAFNKLMRIPPPDGKPAYICRSQALTLILTAQEDQRMDVWNQYDLANIRNYYRWLVKLGHALSHERILIVMLEKNNAINVCAKATIGADFVLVPTIDLWQQETVQNAFQSMLGDDQFGPVRDFDRFENQDNNRWFRDEIPRFRDGNEQEEMGEEQLAAQLFAEDMWFGVLRSQDLEQALNSAVPRSMPTLAVHTQWMLSFLTQKIQPDIESDNFAMISYYPLVRAAMQVMVEVRQNPVNTVEVTLYDCPDELAAAGAFGHRLVMPTLELFAKFPARRWRVWLQYTWEQLMTQLEEETEDCGCQTTNFQEIPQEP